MGRALPDHLIALASTTSTYVPLEKTAEQIRRVALEGDVPRLDRLWASLRVRYPASDNLAQCLIHPELYSRNPTLILAAEKKLVDVVAWLLYQGVEEGGMSKNANGDNILHIAAAGGCPEIIALYHARFADVYDDEESGIHLVDWTNSKGATALCMACQAGSEDAVMTLLSLGASFELHDNEGNTPLHYAAAWGRIGIVRILIQQGANAFVKNNSGYAPSDHAYSDKVVQEIQNEVRGVIEANKRARSAKASRKALSALELDDDPDDNAFEPEDSAKARSGKTLPALPRFLSQSLGVTAASSSPGAKKLGMSVGSGAPPLPLKLLASGLPVPSTPTLASSTGTQAAHNTMETPPQQILPMDIPPSPKPPNSGASVNEHGRVVARMYARDHNAQTGFQASAAYRHLVGSATSASASPGRRPPLATTCSSSASSCSHARRERSSSTDILSGAASSSSSSNASSAGGLRSPGSSMTEGSPFWSSSTPISLPPVPPIPAPHLQSTLAYLNATSIPLPTSPLPGTPAQGSIGLKSSASSFFAARLKRSGSGGSASPPVIPLATSTIGLGTTPAPAPASALEPSFFSKEGGRDGPASAALPALPRDIETAPPLPAKKSSSHAFASGLGLLKQHRPLRT